LFQNVYLLTCYSHNNDGILRWIRPLSFSTTQIQTFSLSNPKFQRIIRGDAAPRNRYPYMVSLTNRNLLLCGGTLIAPDVVLTAHHCVGRVGALELGRYNISNASEQYETHVFQQTITHPRYLASSEKDVDEFDYALIKIYHSTLSPITPITLNGNANIPSTDNQELFVMGWGKPDLNTSDIRSDVLRQAEVYYIVNSRCKLLVASDGNALDDNVFDITLCAADFTELDDSCTGDSGGPIILVAEDGTMDVQVGVTSYGFGCANPELPGIYSRTSYVKEWIAEHVCKLSLYPPADFDCTPRSASVEPDLSGELVNATVTTSLQQTTESHTGWILQSPNDDGVLVTYAYMPIGSYTGDAFSTTTTIQVPNNRAYTFTLFDSYGNGGSGVLILVNGVEILSTAPSLAFTFSVSFEITIGTIPSASPTTSPAPTTSLAPSAAPTTTPPIATLMIQFDSFPEETGWIMQVYDQAQGDYETLQQVYPGTYSKNMTSITQEIRLLSQTTSPMTYKFTMTDNERDGVCCAVGEGSYVLMLNDRILAQGGEFMWEESTVFVLDDSVTSSAASCHVVCAAATLLWIVLTSIL